LRIRRPRGRIRSMTCASSGRLPRSASPCRRRPFCGTRRPRGLRQDSGFRLCLSQRPCAGLGRALSAIKARGTNHQTGSRTGPAKSPRGGTLSRAKP
jgi:hypothetical protein